jgi:hypothetical protein
MDSVCPIKALNSSSVHDNFEMFGNGLLPHFSKNFWVASCCHGYMSCNHLFCKNPVA